MADKKPNEETSSTTGEYVVQTGAIIILGKNGSTRFNEGDPISPSDFSDPKKFEACLWPRGNRICRADQYEVLREKKRVTLSKAGAGVKAGQKV